MVPGRGIEAVSRERGGVLEWAGSEQGLTVLSERRALLGELGM